MNTKSPMNAIIVQSVKYGPHLIAQMTAALF